MAGKQLKDFDAAGALSDADVLYGAQGGAERKVTAGQVAAYLTTKILPQTLLAWAYAQSFQVVSATRDANGAIITANIAWPDGTAGVFTTDVASTAFPGAIDAWHATYVGTPTKTVTQAAVTRDANGAVTAQPAISIS